MGEILIEACRRDNVDLLKETLEGKSEAEAADLLNKTTTVMGNHLYHEAAARGNCTSYSAHTHTHTHTLYLPALLPLPLFYCSSSTLPSTSSKKKKGNHEN